MRNKYRWTALALTAAMSTSQAAWGVDSIAYAGGRKVEAERTQEKDSRSATPSEARKEDPEAGEEMTDAGTDQTVQDGNVSGSEEQEKKKTAGKGTGNHLRYATASNAMAADEGTLPDEDGFLIEDDTLLAYNGSDTEVLIPDTVTSIGPSVFQGKKNIRSVTIPASVTTIGDSAFQGMTKLSELIFEDGSALETIGKDAFSGDTDLKDLELPDGVVTIEAGAFASLGKRFTSIKLPATLEKLGETGKDVFQSSSYLENIDIAEGGSVYESYDGVVYLAGSEEALFVAPGKTGTVAIRDGALAIGASAFEKANIDYIIIPDSVTKIGERAFYSSKLTAVDIPGSVRQIGKMAFYNTKLRYAGIGDGVEEIGDMAFDTNYYLTGLSVPASAVGIGDTFLTDLSTPFTFLRIDNPELKPDLSSIYYMPVTVVGTEGSATEQAVRQMETDKGSSNKLVFVSSDDFVPVSEIKTSAVEKSLEIDGTATLTAEILPENATSKSVTWYTTDSKVVSVETVKNEAGGYDAKIRGLTEGEATVVAVTPDGMKQEVAVTVGWGENQSKLQVNADGEITKYIGHESELEIPAEIDGIEIVAIAEDAFSGDDELTSVILPDTIKKIGDNAFASTGSLREINLPDGLEEIGKSAFEASGVESIVVPASVKMIGEEAFRGMSRLESAVIRTELKELPAGLFDNDSSLTEVALPDSIERIRENAFKKCAQLRTINFPEELRVIDSYAFQDCDTLETVTLPDQVTDVKQFAFYHCSGLVTLNIPASVTNLGDGNVHFVFEGIPESDQGPNLLQNVNIDENNPVYRSIDGSVYSKDAQTFLFVPRGRTELTIAEGVQKIEDYAAYLTFGLKKVTLPSTLKEVGKCAFQMDEELEDMELPDGLEIVRASAFFQLGSWKNVSIPSSVRVIERFGFAETGASELAVPEGIEKIEEFAFWGNSDAERIILPESLREIGDQAFGWMEKVEHLYIPAGVQRIGEQAFGKPDTMHFVTIPAATQEISSQAFTSSETLRGIFIPASVSTIASDILLKASKDLIVFSDRADSPAATFAEAQGFRFIQMNTENRSSADILVEDAQNLLQGSEVPSGITVQITQENAKMRSAAVTGAQTGPVFSLHTLDKEAKTELNGKVTLSIGIPAELSSAETIRLYQVTDDGYQPLVSERIGNRLFAEAESNGVYAMLSGNAEALPEPENPQKPEEKPGTDEDQNGGGSQQQSSGRSESTRDDTVYAIPVQVFTGGSWEKSGNTWKFKKDDGSYARSVWGKINGQWFCFGPAGEMRTGWITDGGKHYLLAADGAMYANGWVLDGANWYYMNADGSRKQNEWVMYQDQWYYLGADGRMAVSIRTPDGYQLDENGHWIRS